MEYLRSELEASIRSAEWMDNLSKRMAIDKLKALDYMLGYPAEKMSDDQLDNYYSAVRVAIDEEI